MNVVWHNGKAFDGVDACPLCVKGPDGFTQAMGERTGVDKVCGGVASNGREICIAICTAQGDHIKIW